MRAVRESPARGPRRKTVGAKPRRRAEISTVEKPDPAADDANRQDDEDIWLTWIQDTENGDANAVVDTSLFAITDDGFSTSGNNTSPRWSPA